MKRSRSNKTIGGGIFLLSLFLFATFLGGAYYESNGYFGNLSFDSYYEAKVPGTPLLVHVIYPQRVRYDSNTPIYITIWITDPSKSFTNCLTISISSIDNLMLSIDKDIPQWSSNLSVSVIPNSSPVKVMVQPFLSSNLVSTNQLLELRLPSLAKTSLPLIPINYETNIEAQTRYIFSKVWEQISIPVGILIAVIGWLISQNNQVLQNQRERVTSQLAELRDFPDKISSEFVDKLKYAHEESNQWENDLQSDLLLLEQEVLDDGYEYLGKFIENKRRGNKKNASEALFNLWDKTGILSREVVVSGLQSLGPIQEGINYPVTSKNLAIFRDYRLQNIVKPLYTLENFPRESQFRNDLNWENFTLQIDNTYRTWLKNENLLLELENEKFLFPFSDIESPYFGEAKLLSQSWFPPLNWNLIGNPRHTLITAMSNWDLQAGLYGYLSNVQANTLDKTFFVQIQLGRQTQKQGVEFVLDALANEWIELINGSNPLVLFEMPEQKQIALVRFLTWAAGGEHELRAWLLQTGNNGRGESKNLVRSLDVMRKHILELSSRNTTPLPSDREKRAWLSLRPEGLVQTNLIVLCSQILGVKGESKKSVIAKQSRTLIELDAMMSSLQVYLKIFSTTTDLPKALFDGYSELKLEWTIDQLSQVCKQRINYCSSKKIGGLDELIWPPSIDSYDMKIAQGAEGSMKNLVTLGSQQLAKIARGRGNYQV